MPLAQLSINASVTSEVSTTATKIDTTTTPVGNTVTQILPTNSNRKGLLIQNTTGQDIYLGFTNGLTASDYSFTIPNNAIYEMSLPTYTGEIYAIVATGSVSPEITEFT